MNEKLFIGSRTKLARARRFIAELEAEFRAFNHSNPFTARFDATTLPPKIAIDWRGLGYEAGAMLGDAVHNLRAALDLLASEMARINGGSDKNVYFPFAASEGEFEAAITKRNFLRAGNDAVALIRTFAPYRGGNELLRALHDLDIEDKHNALLETWKTMDFELQGSYDLTDPLNNEISLDVKAIEHHFGKDSPLAGKHVIETLREIEDEVLRVIDAFEQLLIGRGSTQSSSTSPSGTP